MLIFQQLFEAETSTYTYLLGDSQACEAIIIDPVLEMVERDLKLINELGLRLKYSIETHVHADHITGANILRQRTGCKTVLSMDSGVSCADISLKDREQLIFGCFKIQGFATPGHTKSCMTFVCEGMAFTGDALLIRGTGRTDFQEGSSETLYLSVHQKIFSLPGETKIFPGHDYKGFTSSTVALEQKYNPRLGGGKSQAEFVKIMQNLNLAPPKKIHQAVPANQKCGDLPAQEL